MPVSLIRRLLLTMALCCVAMAARAQTAPFVTATPNQFGFSQCNDQSNITINWDFGTTFVPGTAVSIVFSSTSDCNGTTGTPTTTPSQSQAGSVTVRAADLLFAQTPKDCTAAITSGSPATVYACAKQGTVQTLSAPITFALQSPAAPVGIVVQEGDTHLKLSWSQGSATDKVSSYSLYAAAVSASTGDGGTSDAGTSDAGTSDGGTGALAFGDPVQTNIAATSVDLQAIGGVALANGVTYGVALTATDAYGNVSDLSDPAFGTPKAIDDFYEHYRDAGGSATGGGGCSALGGAGWLLAAFAALFFFARKRRAKALLVLAALGLPSAARAQSDIGQVLRTDERPPRRLLLALKIDRYDPQVDSEAGLVGHPYHDIFHGRAPLRWQLEGGFEALHPFGTLMVGATIGYWQNIGKGVDHDTKLPSTDTALLDVMPFGAVATYRFDWAADNYRIPIIPYAQAGLQAALWASFNGRGDVVTRSSGEINNPGGHGSGWTTGWTSALGVALALDVIDPSLAREAYHDVRLQRTSLFAEYGWTRLSSFNKGGALILSDRAWRFGLALEF